jgi:deazaflavin-dependent oxidoreductase (nitroreductase family)
MVYWLQYQAEGTRPRGPGRGGARRRQHNRRRAGRYVFAATTASAIGVCLVAGTTEFDNDDVIAEFRANRGVVGGLFEGQPLLLLHNRGRKTGTERINPVCYQEIEGGWAVFGSNGASPITPDWVLNTVANRSTTIEIGDKVVSVSTRMAEGEERAQIWDLANKRYPFLGQFEPESGRTTPVIVLTPDDQD